MRSRVDEVRLTGRNTMGVQFAKPGKNDTIVAVARNPEREVEEAVEAVEAAAEAEVAGRRAAAIEAGSLIGADGDDAVSSLDDAGAGCRRRGDRCRTVV